MISRNHRFEDIFKVYTVDQFFLLLEKAKINRNKEILEGSFGMRAALGANQREWKQYIESLISRPFSEKTKVSSKVEYLQFRRLMSHG